MPMQAERRNAESEGSQAAGRPRRSLTTAIAPSIPKEAVYADGAKERHATMDARHENPWPEFLGRRGHVDRHGDCRPWFLHRRAGVSSPRRNTWDRVAGIIHTLLHGEA